ncbi:WD repeat-containing protein 11-like [Mercenaria mercenaria]|uniref:WD repeat-containing protein 11-like n=1 Tax=Mercenaria mercenaria TaxID=6596 RepID=UPI00234F523D|nr:WD repeat-containing protein 11-like [Mercenaria mercenaria]
MRLSPKIITGVLSAQNKGACDWGWQGFVAYGCNSCVVVVDPETVQVLQVLDKHKSPVVKVKWARENYNHDIGSPYSLRLASGDTTGNIVIWDVGLGESKTEFSDGNRPIQELEWLPWQDASHDLLVALHPPYSVILWNADTGTRLWKKSYTENLISLALDPFCFRNMAFLGQDCIVFIDDFSITKTPSSNGKKFYISSPSGGTKSDTPVGSLERKQSSSSSRNLAKRMTKILVGEGKQREEENIALNECIQLMYLRSCRHHLVLVYPREILILDLEINQTVGIIPAERTGSPFLEVLPMRQRDVLYCLHENGSITCRVRRKTNMQASLPPEGSGAFDDLTQNPSLDVTYDLRCQSDSIRMTRHCRVAGVMYSPVSEAKLALVLSDSRLIFWDLHTVDFQADSKNNKSPLYTPGNSANEYHGTKTVPYPRFALCDMIGQSQLLSPDNESAVKSHGVSLKFLMTGLLNGINSSITVVRMCPPLTTKNWNLYEPLLAVGSHLGSVQILNVGNGQIEREYSVHTSCVRGIEWASLKSFMSYSFPKPGTSNLVKNEILLVDIVSGKATPVRTHRDQESPIEMLRVSHLKQYFIITFKDKPLELWDMKTLTILREMSKSVPHPTALEWSPSHSLKALKKKHQLQQEQQQVPATGSGTKLAGSNSEEANVADNASTSSMDNGSSEPKVATKLTVKEHFVYTDSDGTLYHFLVEGNSFTDASKIPPESGMGSVTWLAWKGDYLAFGDADGQLCLWDLKAKTSRTNSTHRGWIKKIRFAPGRGNFKFLVLYNEGVDIWDINEGKPELTASIKSPKEIPKVVDAEWSGSDRPVLATADGCIHMLDITLKKSSCSIEDRELAEDVWSPYLMPPKGAFLMKHLLQHQAWSDQYTLELQGLREEDKDIQNCVNKNLKLIDVDLASYLGNCRFGTAERCLHTARLFGDESEVRFWTIALYYMRSGKYLAMSKSSSCVFGKQNSGDLYIPPTPSHKECSDLLDLNVPGEKGQGSAWQDQRDQPLEKCHDFLCDNESYKRYQLDRLALHDSKRVTYEHTKKCAENYMMLGETDRSVQLLLETEPENESYYIDCLRSCLVASIRSSGASQSTIKLVATNLIANGKLLEGVQLLCLIDKGMDACRYLQTYGAWELAVWLSKSTLVYTECCEVLKRWVEHLSSTHVNQKSTAVLVLLSLGYFHKVIEMLYGMRQFNRAACFIEAATEFNLLEKTEDNGSLIEAVFLEYARQLSNLGHKKSAMFYCQKAGEKGQQLMKEVEILFS